MKSTFYPFEGQSLTLAQIHSRYFPTRSTPWVKRSLLEGATTVAEVVQHSERRLRIADSKTRIAARRSTFSYRKSELAQSGPVR